MKTSEIDTIAAIITPPGEGGIAVLRISGPRAIGIAGTVFEGRVNLGEVSSHTVHFGRITGTSGVVIDEVLVTVFRSPHSYTAEDVVEISCHGSVFLARKILELLVTKGARLAEPGEFTKRAFLNGRMDLSQAEAVADLIRANSESSHNLAIAQLRGSLSNKVRDIRRRIMDLCSLLELELDFSEEDLELIDRKKLRNDLETVISEIVQLIDSYELGKIHREGYRVVLVGPPNVGKSSILNILVKENRAIVTDVSGTTRDTIEESVVIGGVNFNIVDTAGLRTTTDLVENEGIRRTVEQIEHADLILLVVDSTRDLVKQGDIDFIDQYLKTRSHKDLIVVLNKLDKVDQKVMESLKSHFPGFDRIETSATTGDGINRLEDLIHKKTGIESGGPNRETVLVSNLRQKMKLEEAKGFLQKTYDGVNTRTFTDILAIDLRAALLSLSQVIGEDIGEEILNNVFSRFCIGK